MARNRNKERLVSGSCEVGGRTIYFYGKISAVSELQAHYFVCCDIRERFEYNRFVEPNLTMCKTFTSSDYLLRVKTPSGINYYADKERKEPMPIKRPRPIHPKLAEDFGPEGEELVDL